MATANKTAFPSDVTKVTAYKSERTGIAYDSLVEVQYEHALADINKLAQQLYLGEGEYDINNLPTLIENNMDFFQNFLSRATDLKVHKAAKKAQSS